MIVEDIRERVHNDRLIGALYGNEYDVLPDPDERVAMFDRLLLGDAMNEDRDADRTPEERELLKALGLRRM